jgi:hypothetical protein
LGIGLLANEIGSVAVVPIVLVAVSTYCQRFVSSTIGAKRKAWSGEVQKRIGVTATILGSMKSVKIMGMVLDESTISSQLSVTTRFGLCRRKFGTICLLDRTPRV